MRHDDIVIIGYMAYLTFLSQQIKDLPKNVTHLMLKGYHVNGYVGAAFLLLILLGDFFRSSSLMDHRGFWFL